MGEFCNFAAGLAFFVWGIALIKNQGLAELTLSEQLPENGCCTKGGRRVLRRLTIGNRERAKRTLQENQEMENLKWKGRQYAGAE
jgi:hypothetical protein